MSINFFPIKLLLCLFCGISTVISEEYDYTKVDYCPKEMLCDDEPTPNTGCNCKSNPDYKELTSELLIDFRQSMIDTHNQLRQYIASGNEKNNSLNTGAADMNVLNYNLELEHLARCFIHLSYHIYICSNRCWLHGPDGPLGKRYHDKCRKTKTFEIKSGQNLAMQSDDNSFKSKNRFNEPIQRLYDEVTLVTQDVIDKYSGAGKWGHFTQLVWAKATHVGCARGCKAKPTPPGELDGTFCAVACNYGVKKQLMNLIGHTVYKKGKGCSACEQGKKCNSKYTALCGELEPTPQETLKALPSGTGIVATTTITSSDSANSATASSNSATANSNSATASSNNCSTICSNSTTKSSSIKQQPACQGVSFIVLLFVISFRFLMAL